MPRTKDVVNFIVDDVDKIKDFIGKISADMYDYMTCPTRQNARWVMFYKYLTHSDLATFGKATQVNSHSKNLLYYIREGDMLEIEKSTNKPFQTAHQSCIGLSVDFYEKVGLPNPRNVPQYLINDYMSVKLVNSNIQYFSSSYTKQIFEKLDKKISKLSQKSWDFDALDVELSDGTFTDIDLKVAVHGLGTAESVEFHKLRHHMFKGDTFILLCELNGSTKNMFIVLEKNPLFFSILNESNKTYMDYQKRTRDRLVAQVTAKDNALPIDSIEDEVTRQQQSAWRKMLANEMMGYSQDGNQVFCPFTYITADFDSLGALFVASHIKGFRDPNTLNEEKYDINNGLLLCANADALFDKHLISINEKKELVFSFLMDDVKLKSQLLLLMPIFQPVLNEKRMEYLSYHYSVFQQKEQARKQN